MDGTQDDGTLVRLARQGDAGAFEELFLRHHGWVHQLCRSLAFCEADAADLVQEVFVKAHRGLPRLREPEAFRGWLGVIARNLARDARCAAARRGTHERPSADDRDDPLGDDTAEQTPSQEDQVLRAEARQLTARLLDTLPDGTPRRVARLFYLEDREVAEVAAQLGISVSNVTTSLGRARAWLRQHLLLQLGELRGYGA